MNASLMNVAADREAFINTARRELTSLFSSMSHALWGAAFDRIVATGKIASAVALVKAENQARFAAVSYTHLPLPTISSV